MLGPLLGQKALGQHVGAAVLDLASGRLLYGHSADAPFEPASTAKLLTAAAALSTLGPDFRLTTRVVAGSRAGQVVLVGGGDPTLATAPPAGFVPAPASLPALARATAAALRAHGTTTVTLAYDTSLFTGPRTAASWPAAYVTSGIVAPVTALQVDEGRVGLIAEGSGPRVPDPPLTAAKAFARQLGLFGIHVKGAPVPGRAPATPAASASASASASGSASGTASTAAPKPAAPGTLLGSVASPTLSDLFGWMLSTSDNDLAEAVLRQLAIKAGEPADFAGGVTALTGALTALGLPTADLRLYDGSGLAGQTRVPPHVLGEVLTTASSAARPQLRPLLTALAVAGFSGTLAPPRFTELGVTVAAGLLRGKTGTLTGVSALVGTVEDASGRLLAFVFLADQVPAGGTLAARDALDRLGAAVAGCGC